MNSRPSSPATWKQLSGLALLPLFLLGALAMGCDGTATDASEHRVRSESSLAPEKLQERLLIIREAVQAEGIDPRGAYLIAGVGYAESGGLCQCASEYPTSSCHQGPASASGDCDARGVLVGQWDGTCAQGGVGMFQLDAGTQAETLAHYSAQGLDITSVAGNARGAVRFILRKLIDIHGYYPSAFPAYTSCTGQPVPAGRGFGTPEEIKCFLGSALSDPTVEAKWIGLMVDFYRGCVGCSAGARSETFSRYQGGINAVRHAIDWASGRPPGAEPPTPLPPPVPVPGTSPDPEPERGGILGRLIAVPGDRSSGIPGIEMRLYGSTGETVTSCQGGATNAPGDFAFLDLEPGLTWRLLINLKHAGSGDLVHSELIGAPGNCALSDPATSELVAVDPGHPTLALDLALPSPSPVLVQDIVLGALPPTP